MSSSSSYTINNSTSGQIGKTGPQLPAARNGDNFLLPVVPFESAAGQTPATMALCHKSDRPCDQMSQTIVGSVCKAVGNSGGIHGLQKEQQQQQWQQRQPGQSKNQQDSMSSTNQMAQGGAGHEPAAASNELAPGAGQPRAASRQLANEQLRGAGARQVQNGNKKGPSSICTCERHICEHVGVLAHRGQRLNDDEMTRSGGHTIKLGHEWHTGAGDNNDSKKIVVDTDSARSNGDFSYAERRQDDAPSDHCRRDGSNIVIGGSGDRLVLGQASSSEGTLPLRRATSASPQQRAPVVHQRMAAATTAPAINASPPPAATNLANAPSYSMAHQCQHQRVPIPAAHMGDDTQAVNGADPTRIVAAHCGPGASGSNPTVASRRKQHTTDPGASDDDGDSSSFGLLASGSTTSSSSINDDDKSTANSNKPPTSGEPQHTGRSEGMPPASAHLELKADGVAELHQSQVDKREAGCKFVDGNLHQQRCQHFPRRQWSSHGISNQLEIGAKFSHAQCTAQSASPINHQTPPASPAVATASQAAGADCSLDGARAMGGSLTSNTTAAAAAAAAGDQRLGASQAVRQKNYWNYGQLVTSIMDQSCSGTGDAIAAKPQSQKQTIDPTVQQSSAYNYLGFRRPPKRLVYFYDINDDVEEEIDFLTESLETKSYAVSMVGQHDHYLDNIVKSQAAAARLKAVNKLQAAQYKVNAYEAERQKHIRALVLESGGGEMFERKMTTQPDQISGELNQLVSQQQQQAHDDQRLLASSSGYRLLNISPSGGGSERQQRRFSSFQDSLALSNVTSSKSCNIDLPLSPHWSSVPCHLNRTSIAMMRLYQSSLASNFLKGKRERAILNERGRFDKSCCRVDFEAYAKAVDVFMPKDGQPIILDLLDQERGMSSPKARKQTRTPINKLESLSQQHPASDGTDINLGVIYEPFRLFPGIARSTLEQDNGTGPQRGRLLSMPPMQQQQCSQFTSFSAKITTDCQEQKTTGANELIDKANYWQLGLLKSLENYAKAVARYEERQAARWRRAQESACLMHNSNSNLNRTTQAIRRGSAVVLSKLKFSLHGQANNNGGQQQPEAHHQQHKGSNETVLRQLTTYCKSPNVPRLSLTKAESLVNSSGGSQDNQSGHNVSTVQSLSLSTNFTDSQSGHQEHQHQQPKLRSREVAAPTSTSNESLTGSQELIGGYAQTSNTAASVRVNMGDGHRQYSRYLHSPIETEMYTRHSIANLPMQGYPSENPADTTARPMSAYTSTLGAKRSSARPSLIGSWFYAKRSPTSQAALVATTTGANGHSNRNSCFSQTSKATSVSTERCSRMLRPNLRRRRSFSGPLEWLERNKHRPPPYDLMIHSTGKKQTAKRRFKKMKPQKSNSSDYHSLNNRRVYRLDSRGFQTKLKGCFYVITHDPLLVNVAPPQAQDASTYNRNLDLVASSSYDWTQQQQQQALGAPGDRDNMSSNDMEPSFFDTSFDDNNSAADRSLSRDTAGRPASRNAQGQRTFLVYFHWTQWMIKRRNYSLFLFSPKSKIRRFCLAVTSRKEFDYFVLFFISMNCVTLAMERPRIPPWSKEREFLTLANYYFTFMFTLEMVLKVIAKGLYYGKDAYLSDSWNIMDGALVGFSLFDVLLSIVADRSPRIFAILRVFRLLRSLRPLRVINRLMGLKLVVQTLLLSLRPIGNIVLICCTFFIIFGILGVQLFKGTFYYCDGPDPLEIMRTVKTKEDCLVDHRNRWVNRKYNFDNLGQALMALFVLSSKDGWVNIMYTGLDAVGVDMQPRENYNEWRLLYFISFLLLVAFFVLNMFVGVVVENFHRCRKEQELEEKARRAEKRQRKLDKRRRRLREPPYYANYGKFRLLLHKWVTGGYFDLLIAAVIGFNVVFMSLEHYQMPDELIHLLKVSNYVFTAAFIIEAAIKTSALGMRRYLKDRWNQLDVMIVAMSVIGIIFEEMDSFTLPINPTLLRVLRVMRIARVLKLLKMAKGIRALLDTVMQALPQVGNLGLLFFLLFFIFAALGVELFGRLECNDEYPCSGLMDQHAHFQNFGLAFLTLFRVATGDNWNGIMKDTLRDKCDPSSNCLKNCCVSQIIAPLYFVVFVLLAQFVLVNVVVAVLMKHLEESHHEMEIDEEYELDKQLAEELEAKKKALVEARERQTLYWI